MIPNSNQVSSKVSNRVRPPIRYKDNKSPIRYKRQSVSPLRYIPGQPWDISYNAALLGGCSLLAADQIEGTCWYVAVLTLCMKIPQIYNLFTKEMKDYCMSLRLENRVGLCANMPLGILDTYHKRIRQTDEDVQKPTPDSGGEPHELLLSVLAKNDIWYDVIIHLNLNLIPKHYHELYARYFLEIPELDKLPADRDFIVYKINVYPDDAYFKDLMQMIKVLYDEWLQRYNVLILGGFFSVHEDTPSPDYDYGYHAISFTMCRNQINICTWGSCEVDKPHGHTDLQTGYKDARPYEITLLLQKQNNSQGEYDSDVSDDPMTVDINLQTQLVLACNRSDYRGVRDLLINGANPNRQNDIGILPLTSFVHRPLPEGWHKYHNWVGTPYYLNMELDKEWQRPLNWSKQDRDIICLLLNHKADINKKDDYGKDFKSESATDI